jgi:alkylation response protein AidB-like acyl-CoA dehydrogenase
MPAVQKHGSPELRRKVAHEVLSGQKRLCLAISEPDAGSDVQGLTTTAVLTDDGKYYKINGQKKVSKAARKKSAES